MTKKKGWREVPIGGYILKPATSLEHKTGSWRAFRPLWHGANCINCKQCWYVCPDFAVAVKDDKVAGFNYDYCKGCGLCAKICPTKPEKRAITMITETEAKEKDGAR